MLRQSRAQEQSQQRHLIAGLIYSFEGAPGSASGRPSEAMRAGWNQPLDV